MMGSKRINAFMLWSVLSAVAVMPSYALAAPKCNGNGNGNGVAARNAQNSACDRQTTQVPEPSALILLAGGLVAMGVRQMRKSKRDGGE